MNAPVSMRELFRVLLPRDQPNGWLAMLTAYFDDSGTHGRSNVVLVGGIFGTEWQLDSLDCLWRPHIEAPLCGRKPRLSRFHAYDCNNSIGEFTGWNRTETDYFCHQLRTAIIESGVSAYGIAISRRDWNQIVRGHMKGFLGDAESYAITQCYVRTLQWAQENTFDPLITLVFDNRPSEIQRRAKTIGDAFERHTTNPKIVGCTFLSSKNVRALQAADLVAWEIYQHANAIFAARRIIPPKRKELQHLNANIKMILQYANREAIRNIVGYVRGERSRRFIQEASDHFTKFDPSSPDYSHLSGLPPSGKPSQIPSGRRKRRPRAPC